MVAEPLPQSARRAGAGGGLSLKDWPGILKRAGKESLDDNLPMIASALAYSSFFAIPSVLLLTVGLFSLVASPDTINDLVERFSTFMPADAAQLIGDSLQRLEERPSSGILISVVGFVLAVWSMTGAMTTYMTALNDAYEREDKRGFVRKRVVALGLAGAIGVAVALVAVFLILGPYVERWIGDALGIAGVTSWLWWVVQWPVLAGGLLVAFALLLYFAPDVEHRRWQVVTPGALVALAVWLVASVGFALYAGFFGSYNKTWGSLSAVIVTLTWLWLTSLALLFGGEVNAEVERSREAPRGGPAGADPRAPSRPA